MKLRETLRSGATAVGTFQTIDSAMVSEMIGLAGMDFVILDQEHGPLTAETILPLAAAAEQGGAAPIVRVRENTEGEIQRALDAGVAGVEIPQIETREDAEKAVSYSRFAPDGERGLSPYVRAGGYDGSDDYTAEQNEDVAVIVHVEGERAIKNIEEIAGLDGIDVVFLGPYDLSQSVGVPGKVRDEQVIDMMEHVCDVATDAGAVVGTYADDAEMANTWIELGAQYVATFVDAPLLRRACEGLLEEIRV